MLFSWVFESHLVVSSEEDTFSNNFFFWFLASYFLHETCCFVLAELILAFHLCQIAWKSMPDSSCNRSKQLNPYTWSLPWCPHEMSISLLEVPCYKCKVSGLAVRFPVHTMIALHVDIQPQCLFLLKTLDTFGKMHKITNLWKFQLDWSTELRDIYERKKHPCHTKLCAFRCFVSWPQILNLRSQKQISGKLHLSQKLRHF